ncbi:MAG: EAL domain-containing protein [Pseudomonadota bacterium]|nr:EAL domain-containing protein [Pseudomonadota bacterium]
MNDSETLFTHHKALMELSHDAEFVEQSRPQKLAALTELCAQRLDVERVSVWTYPPSHDRINCEWLHDRAGAGHQPKTADGPVSLLQSEHPAYFATISTERVLAADDARTDPRTDSFTEGYLKVHGIHSMLDAPIFSGKRMSGIICLEAKQPRQWSLPDISFAAAVADTVSLMNTHEAWMRSKQALDYATRFDALTGLANMTSLRSRLNRLVWKSRRSGQGGMALIWLDLDRLKVVNDGLGPQAGDQVIGEIGRRLDALDLPGKDCLARIGGDEFALIIRNQPPQRVAGEIAETIQQRVRAPIRHGDQDLDISASMGISHFPGECLDAEELLRNAEAAMYHAKSRGRAQSVLFDSEIQMTARSRFAVENELRQALDQDSLDVFYQPIMNRSATRVVYLEALVRWHHPVRGWLPPIEFLDVARSAGLMYKLGSRVLERVCRDWRACQDAGIELATVSVNLAPEQVQVSSLPNAIGEICARHDVPVGALQFEVTEDALQGELGALSGILDELVAMGAELAIDDFGTGYSSLARLKTLPFASIKIDRSFIKNLPDDDNDRAITLSILGLARGLGLSVVAEGVETEAHERWLIETGCDFLQGFRYSKPLPLAELCARFYPTGGKRRIDGTAHRARHG